MKTSKVIVIALLVSAFATVSVINIQLAKPKDVSEVTLDMMDIMTRAFDESEGGESNDYMCPYATYEEIGDDMQANICTSPAEYFLCQMVWYDSIGVYVTTYKYSEWWKSWGDETSLTCSEAVINP